MTGIKYWLPILLVAVLTQPAGAQTMDLPDEELAKESVLPVFTRPGVVRNRNIVTNGRFDLNLMYGLALSEPIFNTNRYSLAGYYHTSEEHAFGLMVMQNSSGLSSYANQLHDQFGLDFTRVPQPKQSILVDWNSKLFYGKMSVTKKAVFNISLYSTLVGGVINYEHKTYPTIGAGLGQKFYFGKNFSFRFDMRLYGSPAPIPFLQNRLNDGSTGSTANPKPTFDEFEERLTFTTVLDAGVSWLF